MPDDIGLLDLGVIRIVTSVSLHEKAYTVVGPISELPFLRNEAEDSNTDIRCRRGTCSLELTDVDRERTTPVYTLQLRSMHEDLFLHDFRILGSGRFKFVGYMFYGTGGRSVAFFSDDSA